MKKVRAHMRPTVMLTEDDIHELRVLTADLERELLRTYEDFLFRDERQVDDKRWKPVRAQGEVQVFRERNSYMKARGKHKLPSLTDEDDDGSKMMEIGPQGAMAVNSKMPLLLAHGTMPGTLDDALYGASFHDTKSLRARDSYIKTAMEEYAVVSVIDAPTAEDPFQFLGLVWFYRTYPISGIISSRDMLMLVSHRYAQLSNGERTGVTLYHSIEHRDVPVRRDLGILRAEISVSTVYRPLDSLWLDVFVTNFVDAKGSTPDSLVISDTARGLLGITGLGDVALRRKLFHRMREAQATRKRKPSLPGSQTSDDGENCCAMCAKSFSGLFSASGSSCQICFRRVCSKCVLTKELVIESTRTDYTAKPFDFCLVCTLAAKEVPALAIAREELKERMAARPSGQSASSSSRESSIASYDSFD